jgi:hypothetical protein
MPSCDIDRHKAILIHEYQMGSPSMCFGCGSHPEDVLRGAGAVRVGISDNALCTVRTMLQPPTEVTEALRRAGVASDMTAQGTIDYEMWLIDSLTSAALVAQRDLLVEDWLDDHGTREELARSVANIFQAAAKWSAIFESELIRIPGTRSQWRLVRGLLNAASRVLDHDLETLSKIAAQPLARGQRRHLGTKKRFKACVKAALKRHAHEASSAIASRVRMKMPELYKTICEDALGVLIKDPGRELRQCCQGQFELGCPGQLPRKQRGRESPS